MRVLRQSMTATPRTGSPAASAGTSRSASRDRPRFQLRCRRPDTQDTSATAPGWRSAASIRRSRNNAERTSAVAYLYPPSSPRQSRGPTRLIRLRNNDQRSQLVLVSVPIVVANPSHREGYSVFVTALRHEIEVTVGADQKLRSTCVAGIGVEDVTGLVLIEHADAGGFLAWEPAGIVIVIVAIRHFLVRERHAIVVVDVAPIR